MFLSQIVLNILNTILLSMKSFYWKSHMIVHEMEHRTIKNKLKSSNDFCNNYKV